MVRCSAHRARGQGIRGCLNCRRTRSRRRAAFCCRSVLLPAPSRQGVAARPKNGQRGTELQLRKLYVIYPGAKVYTLDDTIEVIGIQNPGKLATLRTGVPTA